MDAVNHGIAFAELVSHIEDARMDNLVAPIFKLSDLVSLYSIQHLELPCLQNSVWLVEVSPVPVKRCDELG